MSKSIEKWWECLGWKNWLEKNFGNVCLSLSECLTTTQLSMQILGYQLHISWLKSQKAVAQELIFIFSEVVWKPSWVVFFHPDLYFWDDSFFCCFFLKDGRKHKLCLSWVFPPSLPPSLHGETMATHGGRSLLAHQPPISLTGLGQVFLATSKAEGKVQYTLKYLLPGVSVWDMTSFPSGIYGVFIHVIKRTAQWQAEVTCGLVLAWNFHKE